MIYCLSGFAVTKSAAIVQRRSTSRTYTGGHITQFRAQIKKPYFSTMTVFMINMAYTKLLLKSELGLVSRIDFGIFIFQSRK